MPSSIKQPVDLRGRNTRAEGQRVLLQQVVSLDMSRIQKTARKPAAIKWL